MALSEGAHAVALVMRDTSDPDVTSEVVMAFTVEVLPRSQLLMFTSSGGSTGSMAESVVAGRDPAPAVLWLINIADGGGALNFTVEVDGWRGGVAGAVAPPMGWASVSTRAGSIQYSGALAEIYVNFTTAPTAVQVMQMAFIVANSRDADPQKVSEGATYRVLTTTSTLLVVANKRLPPTANLFAIARVTQAPPGNGCCSTDIASAVIRWMCS
eukprot:535632-Prorocentrum_minimum.AAC.7